MRFIKHIFVIALWLISFMAQSQLDSILVRFNAIVDGGKIRLDWTIKGGHQCNGTVIKHSVDSINFMNIGSIPGICGSPFYDESYSFTDEQPVKNSVNYYRIDLVGIGESKIVSRENYNLSGSNILVIPNPLIADANIIFENPVFETCTLDIFNPSGKILLCKTTRKNRFQISASNFQAGIYFFLIRKEKEIIGNGKLVIQ
ncbi:MAG: T9SS type A sorting domain-containing protein [Bacteroidales bacterium]|nr:T9SS type A sorting domain-containing protein [Bacteroidales bacterium]MCF8457572.1 T9SS type A sorting domain-containing protein [Bacteroidales bacterium]